MAKICFTTETTADFPNGLPEKENIHIIPVHIIVDAVDYLDGFTINRKEVLDFMRKGSSVSTRPPAPAEYADFYDNLLKKFDYIISFHVASNLSECYQSAKNSLSLLPEEKAKRIKVIDTQSISIGQALYILKSIDVLRRHKKVSILEQELEKLMATSVNNFTVDSLTWLKKSGKIGTIGAAIGDMLDIKPVLAVKNSELKPVARVRGKEKTLKEMASYAGKTKKSTGYDYDVWISHCEAENEAEFLRDELAAQLEMDPEEIKIMESGATISIKIGPGSCAWGMIKKDI